jgi:hypothetical protein
VVRVGRIGELHPLAGEVQRHLRRRFVGHPTSLEGPLRAD